ncbi:DUF2510 domain-containing protein [Diaminobutyricibacter sp. McL0608]|uniref:DUF2510 domain-containing protein n=1 Tax=Leifsonia sp. McL0608 TaxID=3143537 RepID=UPI0031F2F300
MTDAPAPEAGWYPDPTGPLGERWWTGATWSEHTRESTRSVSEIIAEDAQPVEEDDDGYAPQRPGVITGGVATGVVGRGRLRNVLAYRSLNCGAAAAILFVVTVVCADLAWRVSPYGVLGWISVALCLVGTGIAIMAILYAAVSFFRVRTYHGLGPGLTGLAFGLVFAFSIPLAGLALRVVLDTFG